MGFYYCSKLNRYIHSLISSQPYISKYFVSIFIIFLKNLMKLHIEKINTYIYITISSNFFALSCEESPLIAFYCFLNQLLLFEISCVLALFY